MKQFEDVKEIREFFENETLKFKFRTDGILHFETIRPKFVDGRLVDYELRFFDDVYHCFFGYSTFEEWLEPFQINEVIAIKEDKTTESLYFAKYEEMH